MKAIIYYRISTADRQDVGMQQKAIKDYCERENIQILKEYLIQFVIVILSGVHNLMIDTFIQPSHNT